MENPFPLYLASRSPRRKELLAQAGIRFQVHVPKEDEIAAPKFRKKVAAKVIVEEISRGKAHAAVKELRELGVAQGLVLSADTLVFFRQHVLGKPADADDARRMLRKLSGNWHEVYTGVTVLRFTGSRVKENAIQVRTKVRFFKLKPDWIDWYLATGEPFDKAGSYGCQAYGAALVQEFKGSYTNVVGLPLGESLALLERTGKTTRAALQIRRTSPTASAVDKRSALRGTQ
ncbi:MAG: Maf family protein [Bdellovibrionota bacterium]